MLLRQIKYDNMKIFELLTQLFSKSCKYLIINVPYSLYNLLVNEKHFQGALKILKK